MFSAYFPVMECRPVAGRPTREHAAHAGSEGMQYRAEEFCGLDSFDGHGPLVGQELVTCFGTVLFAADKHVAVELEENLDRRELSGPVGRPCVQADEPEAEVAFGEVTEPLVPHARVTLLDPVVRLWVHGDYVGVPRRSKLELAAGGVFEDRLRTVRGLLHAILIGVVVEPLLENTLFVQLGVGRLTLRHREIAVATGSTCLQNQCAQTFFTFLRSVMDTLREVADPTLFQVVGLRVRQPTLDDVTDLIEVVPVTRGSPPTATGVAGVQVVVVGRAVHTEQ